MEKISCEIISDLLPLYCDEVCSQDSRRLVEEHLKGCPGCCELLRQIKKEYLLPDAEEQEHEAVVKDLAAVWKKTVKGYFVRGMLIALCACALLGGGFWSLTRLFQVVVPAERLQISVEAATEQSVVISLRVTDGKRVLSQSHRITEDGKYYILIKRGVIATENGAGENWENTVSISRTGILESGEKVSITEIYYGTEDDNILVWQAVEGTGNAE
ncbi:MAG: zf-HC2 domain-containing protein [Lachnospiraceae bacterium]|nr:zf-HC2 domain-containing protein [Lachnospiraceae bacterium]